jgi:hypothetical protein
MATISTPSQPRPDTSALSQAAGAARASEARRTAVAPDREVEIVRDPSLFMAEMAEELAFLASLASEGDDEIASDNDEAFDDLISELLRKSLKAQKANPAQHEGDAKALRDRLVDTGTSARPGNDLEAALRRLSGGSSQQALALMAELAEMAKTDPELQRLGFGQKALEDYALAHEAGLVAALNIAGVLEAGPQDATGTAQRLLGLYEESIASSQSVLQTFHRLGQSEGITTLGDWRKFLTEAVAADLATQTSGGEKVQLQLILLELKGMRTFNTLTQGLEKLAKMLPKAEGKAPDLPALMQTTLDYVEQPLREMPRLESLARDLKLPNQILLFQGFRNLLKSMPDDAFASPEQKAGTLMPLQKRVDDLTWTEEV